MNWTKFQWQMSEPKTEGIQNIDVFDQFIIYIYSQLKA